MNLKARSDSVQNKVKIVKTKDTFTMYINDIFYKEKKFDFKFLINIKIFLIIFMVMY